MTTTVTGVDQAVVDMMGAVFAEHRESHPPTALAERDVELWHALDDLGLVRLTGGEASGGSGAGWYEAAELWRSTRKAGFVLAERPPRTIGGMVALLRS